MFRREAYGTPGISAAARYTHAAPGYLLATVRRISRVPTGTLLTPRVLTTRKSASPNGIWRLPQQPFRIVLTVKRAA